MADAALAASALLMGLAGGPHCVAMCGAAQAGVAARGGRGGTVALQLGRLVGYTAAGALVAASVSMLAQWGAVAPALRPVWHVLHVGAIALGAWLLWYGRAPDWLARLGERPRRAPDGAQPIRIFARVPAPLGAAAAGTCWAAMPCGLLQSALIIAALASGPLWGAGVMAAFAIATTLSLGAASALWARLATRRARLGGPTLAVRLAGALLVGSSAFALAHGLSADIVRAICGTA